MNDVHNAAARLDSLFSGNPHVDWDNASRDVVADLVTLARDWFERRDTAVNRGESQDEMLCGHCHHETPHTVYDAGHERDSSHDWRRCNVCGWKAYGMSGKYHPPIDIEA